VADRRERAETLGAALRARRRALGLTQEEIADLAGVSLRFVHDAEHDKPSLQLDRLLLLLSALGLHLELKLGAGHGVLT
jgi:HTH-type transcriptional regulator / antitoxin HipB